MGLQLGLALGGSPRSASTFSMPAAAHLVEDLAQRSTGSPTQVRCAIASMPRSSLIRFVTSTVRSRVEPPAP